MVDVLALALPASQVFPPVRNLVYNYMLSSDPSHRRAALMMLGTCVEGIAEYLAQHMSDVWQIVDRGMSDADAEVRKAACTAIGCLCEHCEDECASRHGELMPAILTLLNEPVTQKHACIALDSMLEILPNDVEPYLNPIMERLVALLDTVPIEIKSVIMGAIGSAAHSSKERFLPYFQGTVSKVQQFLTLGDSVEEVELKGITMDSLGTFAQAVGKEAFQPYFADLMKQAFVFIGVGDARLAECSFIIFDVLSDVFGEDFAPYLPTVIPAIINSLQQAEHSLEDEKREWFLRLSCRGCFAHLCWCKKGMGTPQMLQPQATPPPPLSPSATPTTPHQTSKTSTSTSSSKPPRPFASKSKMRRAHWGRSSSLRSATFCRMWSRRRWSC